jgi:hyperosmotically inducible periplasmic protein
MKELMRIWPLVALTMATLVGSGCTRTDDGYRIETERAASEAEAALDRAGEQLERGAAELERRAQPALEDATITAKVKAKLTADPEVNPFRIDVDTVNHVVTLTGTVKSAAVSAEAEKLARQTAGVRAVVNRLQIEGEVPAVAP